MGVDSMMVALFPQDTAFDDNKLRRLSFELAEAVGPEHFSLWPDEDRHALSIDKAEDYEGLPSDRVVVRIAVATRFYGPGYERGNLSALVMMAEWLERRMPECEVWYGPDSSCHMTPFDKAAREALLAHWATNGGRPYWGDRSPGNERHEYGRPRCDFCRELMVRFGWGAGYADYTCGGCNLHKTTRNSGKTWAEERK